MHMNKLIPRLEGPFNVIENVNDNAYKLKLPEYNGVSATFDIEDLTPYLHDEKGAPFMSSAFEEWEVDTGVELAQLLAL